MILVGTLVIFIHLFFVRISKYFQQIPLRSCWFNILRLNSFQLSPSPALTRCQSFTLTFHLSSSTGDHCCSDLQLFLRICVEIPLRDWMGPKQGGMPSWQHRKMDRSITSYSFGPHWPRRLSEQILTKRGKERIWYQDLIRDFTESIHRQKKKKTNLVVLDNHSDEREREITKNNISRMECCGALGKPLLGMPTCNEFLLAFLLPHSLGPD